MAKITFLKQNCSTVLKDETEFIKMADLDPKTPLKFGCRRGECGVCAIKVLSGNENLSPLTKQEKETLSRLKRTPSHRLACQCAIIQGEIFVD